MLSENAVPRTAWVLTVTQQSCKAILWAFTQVKGRCFAYALLP